MNRYIAGGLLAALAVMLGAGIESLGNMLPNFSGNNQPAGQAATTGRAQSAPLGTQPIEQAGRAVQRQSQATGAAPTTTFDRGRTPVQGTSTLPQEIPNGEIRPQPDNANVIPRPGAAPQATTTLGDVSPIQPDLVQPGSPDLPGIDQDLDAIPALW